MVRHPEKPYTVPNRGPVPKIGIEEGLEPEGLNHLAWVEDWRKNLVQWEAGLPWYDRLHAHATMSSFRRRLKRPFAPQCELDFVLESIFCPLGEPFPEKPDPYLHKETAYGEDLNIDIQERRLAKVYVYRPSTKTIRIIENLRKAKWVEPPPEQTETWRVLRNRVTIHPPKKIPRDYDLLYADLGPVRREHFYNVKLGIAADHAPQTNPGYSRTPSGTFYGI